MAGVMVPGRAAVVKRGGGAAGIDAALGLAGIDAALRLAGIDAAPPDTAGPHGSSPGLEST
jgi:hypothetical protein